MNKFEIFAKAMSEQLFEMRGEDIDVSSLTWEDKHGDSHVIPDEYVGKVLNSDIHKEQIKLLLYVAIRDDVTARPTAYILKRTGKHEEYVYSSDVYDHAYLVDAYIHDEYVRDHPEFENVHVCDFCGSDNVQTKAWVRPNRNNEYVDMASEEINDNYCDDCEENACLTVVKKNVRHAVIGFQVIGDSGTAEDGKHHPHMTSEKCVYSLDQANSMMDDDNQGDEQWVLKAVWTDEIECPTMMFETDPRDPRVIFED